MVVINNGKNRIRDLIANDVDTGAMGTDGTDVEVTDTDLRAKDNTTIASATVTTGNKIVNVEHVLLSTLGNGTTFKEYATYMNGGTVPLNIVVYPDFLKTSSVEARITSTVRIE